MTPLYSETLRTELLGKLRTAAVLLFLAAVAGVGSLAFLAGGPLTLGRAVCGGLVTAMAGIGGAAVFQRRFLPLYRAHRLLTRLAGQERTVVSGVFRGFKEAKDLKQGVLMRKLRLDAGDRVKKEYFEREIQLPAVFSSLSLREGEPLELELAENVLMASGTPIHAKCDAAGGAYRIPPLLCAAVLLLSAALWGSLYSQGVLQTQGDLLHVAVCSIAHHQETDDRIMSAVAADGGPALEISYSSTLDGEQTASFLATFGAFEADILFLNQPHFESVFYREGCPLDTLSIEQALGFTPRYVTDDAGRATAVILYQPGDEAYNRSFSGLYDWFAVDASLPLVVTIRDGSPYGENGQGQLALERILCAISE